MEMTHPLQLSKRINSWEVTTGKGAWHNPRLPAGVSLLGLIEEATGWPRFVAPRADSLLLGLQRRPALRLGRHKRWQLKRTACGTPRQAVRLGNLCKYRDCWLEHFTNAPSSPLPHYKNASDR